MEVIVEENNKEHLDTSISKENDTVKLQIEEIEKKIINEIKDSKLVIANEETDIDEYLAMTEEDKYNMQIAKKKLEQAKQLKEEYENRLKAVQFDIELLEGQNNKSSTKVHKSINRITEMDPESKEKFKKIASERKRLEELRKKRVADFENSFSASYIKSKEEEKQRLEQIRIERQRKANEEIERINQMHKERETTIEQRNAEYASLKKKKPKFVSLQEKYKQKERKKEEEIKKVLNSIRNQYQKPIVDEDFKGFEKEYMRNRKEKIEAGKKAIEERAKYEVKKMPENYFTKLALEEYNAFKSEKQRTKEELNGYRTKIQEYNKQVYEHFMPTADPKKIKEREELVKSIHKKPNSYSPDLPHIKGIENLEFIRKLPKKKRSQGGTSVSNEKKDIQKIETKSEKYNNTSNSKYSFWSTRKNLGNSKFLEIEKIRKQLQDENISEKDKLVLMDRYKILIEQVEKKATYKEKLEKYKNDYSLKEEDEEIEEIYINAINSKLAMLKEQT